MVSVVVPNYNRASFLGQTLESLIAQTYPHWEALVVDDGSTDNSAEVALAYQARDSRIRFIVRNREPQGAPTCRNLGLEAAGGAYVIFLDSDDLLAPHCLAQRVAGMLAHPELDFMVFPMLVFQDDPANASHYWNLPSDQEPDIERFLRLDAVWQTTGPIWKREAVQRIGGFTEGLACWQDVDFHLKALIAGLNYQHAQSLPDAYYRRHVSGSVSQSEISTPPKLRARLHVFRTHAGALAVQGAANPGLRKKLQQLGANVVFGAIKVHNWDIARKALAFGLRRRIFGVRFTIAAVLLALLTLLRLTRVGAIDSFGRKLTSAWRTYSTIGHYTYTNQQKN